MKAASHTAGCVLRFLMSETAEEVQGDGLFCRTCSLQRRKLDDTMLPLQMYLVDSEERFCFTTASRLYVTRNVCVACGGVKNDEAGNLNLSHLNALFLKTPTF